MRSVMSFASLPSYLRVQLTTIPFIPTFTFVNFRFPETKKEERSATTNWPVVQNAVLSRSKSSLSNSLFLFLGVLWRRSDGDYI